MKNIKSLSAAISAAFFIASAHAQNSGTITNNAFAIGKGPGVTGFASVLCTQAQIAIGQNAAKPICAALSGDVTMTAGGVTAIGATKVTSAMLNADVFSTAHSWAGQQTFTAPILGTPASGTLTNATGLPIAGLSGLGTGCATFLGTPSSANLRGCLTDEVGTGAAYFVGGALGTPASATLTNATGLPLTGLSSQGAWTFVGNNGASAAIPTAVDIPTLTAKASPAGTDLLMISDQAAAGAWKKATISSIASAGSVSSIDTKTGTFTTSNGLDTTAGNSIELTPARRTLPTQQVFTSGSGTYTTPANVLWIEIQMVGGGGGGGGGGTGGGGTGAAGGTTSFGTLSATGGQAGSPSGGSPSGGTASGGYLNTQGGQGGSGGGAGFGALSNPIGGYGGSSCQGGGAGGAFVSSSGQSAASNTGAGGGGGSLSGSGSGFSGAGGAAGGCLKAIINSPAATYSYSVGGGGSGAGTAGTSGTNGGNGGSGVIAVIEHYGT